MILLRPDCLVFRTANGEQIPCSAHEVTVELMGDCAEWIDHAYVQEAAEAVLHYFKAEKGQTAVSVAEFSEALERVLRGLGLDSKHSGTAEPGDPAVAVPVEPRVVEADLRQLADESGRSCELFFFPRLRAAVHQGLDTAPHMFRLNGLRPCVKQLTGAKRWSPHCQALNDQIVDYLRTCLTTEKNSPGCTLVVR